LLIRSTKCFLFVQMDDSLNSKHFLSAFLLLNFNSETGIKSDSDTGH
jgi:hypothetical protein